MANLVLTNLDTGQQTVITDTLTLDEAIASVKTVYNAYTDNSTSNVLIQANNYSDSIVLNAISEILPTIPLVDYPQNSGAVRLVVGKNDDGTLKFFDVRNEKYIQAGDLLSFQNSKAFTLAELAKAKLKITEEIKNTTSQTQIKCNVYTDTKIADVNKQIQTIEVASHTFETWLNYFARADAYLDELYDTVDEEYYRQMGWIT